MLRSGTAALLLLLSVLGHPGPAEAWYKQAAGPSYYSVGRASGLLSGIRRSPVRRADRDPQNTGLTEPNPSPAREDLQDLNVCVKSLNPDLRSCQLVQDPRASFLCEATVLISLDSRECSNF